MISAVSELFLYQELLGAAETVFFANPQKGSQKVGANLHQNVWAFLL